MANIYVTMVDVAKTNAAMGLGNTCLLCIECFGSQQAHRVAAYAEQIPAYSKVKVTPRKPKTNGVRREVEHVLVHKMPAGWPD